MKINNGVLNCYCVTCGSTNKIDINYDGDNLCNDCGSVLVSKDNKLTYNALARVKAKVFVKNYLSTHSCELCGENRIWVLDFHHKDRKDKENNINDMIKNRNSIKTIQKEIDKCDVLCSNCHRELHYFEKLGIKY